MALAARAVLKALEDAPDATGTDLLTKVAVALGSVGGASGPIYASATLAVAAKVRAGETDPLALAEVAEAAITKLGGAKPGDKTIVDALHPALEALRDAGDVRPAALAAREGAEA